MKSIYFVLPCYNEEVVIENSADELGKLVEKLIREELIAESSKIVFVNDGSEDKTWNLITQLSA